MSTPKQRSRLRVFQGTHAWQHLAAAVALCSSTWVGAAAPTVELAQAQARHQRDRAACISGHTNQDRQTCLAEVDAMLAEVKRGRVMVLDEKEYQANRLRRCELTTSEDQEDCTRRMNGEGTTSGTAEAGGIYRELSRTVEPALKK